MKKMHAVLLHIAATLFFIFISSSHAEYIDNGDGTFTDTDTNLMWCVKDNGEGILFKNALEYIYHMNQGRYYDWGLPSTDEMLSIKSYINEHLIEHGQTRNYHVRKNNNEWQQIIHFEYTDENVLEGTPCVSWGVSRVLPVRQIDDNPQTFKSNDPEDLAFLINTEWEFKYIHEGKEVVDKFVFGAEILSNKIDNYVYLPCKNSLDKGFVVKENFNNSPDGEYSIRIISIEKTFLFDAISLNEERTEFDGIVLYKTQSDGVVHKETELQGRYIGTAPETPDTPDTTDHNSDTNDENTLSCFIRSSGRGH